MFFQKLHSLYLLGCFAFHCSSWQQMIFFFSFNQCLPNDITTKGSVINFFCSLQKYQYIMNAALRSSRSIEKLNVNRVIFISRGLLEFWRRTLQKSWYTPNIIFIVSLCKQNIQTLIVGIYIGLYKNLELNYHLHLYGYMQSVGSISSSQQVWILD